MTLSEYIEDVGDEAAAKLFGVEPRTVAAWRRGERVPRMRKAREIVAKSNGLLKLEDCYDQQAA